MVILIKNGINSATLILACSLILCCTRDVLSGKEEEEEPEPPSGFSQENKDKIANGRKHWDRIRDEVKRMKKDKSTSHMIPGTKDSVDEKLDEMKPKWTKQLKEAYKADKEGMAERISGSISGASEGFSGMVNAYRNKDWNEGVQGALTFIAGILQLGGPKLMIASAVVSFISSLFSLFGGSAQTESMDDKIERIVKEQLDIAREKDLKAELKGFKLQFRSLASSLQHFRESKKLERPEANELYNQLFSGLVVIGKIRARTEEICDVDTSKSDKDKEAKKCLQTINMLCDISILRQVLMTDMASVLADVNDAHEAGLEGGLLVVANNILNVIKKEQEEDGKFLSFITDPFNNPNRRYVSSLFFCAPSKYPTILSYIRSLDKIVPGGMFQDYVMMCKGSFLTSTCNILEIKDYPSFVGELNGWKNIVKSVFLPKSVQLTAYSHSNFEKKSWGPYVGPNSIELKSGQGHNDWDSVKISTSSRDALKEVRVCEASYLNPSRCHTLQHKSYNLGLVDGLNFDGVIKSIYIPRNTLVTGASERDLKGTTYSFYVGEDTVNEVYDYGKWRSIRIESFTAKISKSANEQVKYCHRENLGGVCRTTWSSVESLGTKFHMNFARKIRSIQIPGGLRVTGYSEENFEGSKYGPYTGPAIISKVDPIDTWKSMKITEFNEELPDEEEL